MLHPTVRGYCIPRPVTDRIQIRTGKLTRCKWAQASKSARCIKMFSQSISGFAGTVRKLFQVGNQMAVQQIRHGPRPRRMCQHRCSLISRHALASAKTPASMSFRPRAAARWWLDSPYLERDGKQFRVSAGMVVSAEVNLGSRTVMEYLLSPVQKGTHEAGRER